MSYFRLKRVKYSIIVKTGPQDPHTAHSPEPFTDLTLTETTAFGTFKCFLSLGDSSSF